MIKPALGLIAVAALMGTPALAADLAAKALAPAPVAAPAPAYSWTGFYVGANAGYEWTDPKTFPVTGTQNIPPLAGIGPLTAQADGFFPLTSGVGQSGAIGGVQAGYNWQFSSWVTGVEGDFDFSSAKGSSSTFGCCGPATAVSATNTSRRLDALGTLRGRFGFAADNTLYYLTGGLAVGESTLGYAASMSSGLGNLGSASNSATTWQGGWTIGAGIEYAPWQHWSVKVEYLYYDLGTQSTTVATNVPAAPGEFWTATTTVRNNGQIVRGGVNYKF